MGALDNPGFWSNANASVGQLRTDGSLKYVLLDKTYKMMPLIRNSDTTFLKFLAGDSDARKCPVIVNGNFYGLDWSGRASVFRGKTADPSDTEIQGRVVRDGKVVAGDSRPQSFWFGQISVFTGDAWNWTFAAEQGDPPAEKTTLAAIGGVGPLIAGAMTYGACSEHTLKYGTGNRYRPGAPPGVLEPDAGEPPAAARPFLIQRNNETFKDASRRPPQTGKTILAYCSAKRMLLVAVQENGVLPGQTHSDLVEGLARQGFDAAVFLDGSDSATLVMGGTHVIKPGERKDNSMDVGVGFYK